MVVRPPTPSAPLKRAPTLRCSGSSSILAIPVNSWRLRISMSLSKSEDLYSRLTFSTSMQRLPIIPPSLCSAEQALICGETQAGLLLNSIWWINLPRQDLHKDHSRASVSDSHLSPATSECEGLKCAGSHLQRHLNDSAPSGAVRAVRRSQTDLSQLYAPLCQL